jgi:hypothetical protein
MEIYTKHNFYKDFVTQRNKAMKAVSTIIECREISPWDRVGVHSKLEHTKEMTDWIEQCIGSFEYVNKTRHFNACQENPYNFAHVHYDDYDYIVVLGLNLPSQLNDSDGTVIVSHKETRDDRKTEDIANHINPNYGKFQTQNNFDEVLAQEEIMYNSDHMNPDKWDIDLFVPLKCNKAMMFEAKYLHRESRNFGKDLVSCRLVEVVYINKKTKAIKK